MNNSTNFLDTNDIFNVDYPIVNIIGSRYSGKTTLVIQLLQEIYKYKKNKSIKCVIFTLLSKHKQSYINAGFSKRFLYSEYDEKILNQITNFKDDNNTETILVIDDLLIDLAICEIIMNNVKYKTTIIFTSQFPQNSSPTIRHNIDATFIFADNYITNLKKIYESYAIIFPTFESFTKVFNKATQNYNSMVILHKKVLIEPIQFNDIIKIYNTANQTNQTDTTNQIKNKILEQIINSNDSIIKILTNDNQHNPNLDLLLKIVNNNKKIIESFTINNY